MIVITLGDLHGQMASLARLETVQARYPDATTVFIGDYLDCFGDHNPGFNLIKAIQAMQASDPVHISVLMGNHEAGAVNFMSSVAQADWLHYGGMNTLMAEAKQLGLHASGTDQLAKERLALVTREALLNTQSALLDWMASLPLIETIDQLVLVHAGIDQTLADPIHDSTASDILWLRGGYWYDPNNWEVFDHNRFGKTVISGHTPTGIVTGRYQGGIKPDKRATTRNPIYAIQYPGELPRYLIDGDAGGHDAHLLGNIAVFDSETGLLIDAYEDM